MTVSRKVSESFISNLKLLLAEAQMSFNWATFLTSLLQLGQISGMCDVSVYVCVSPSFAILWDQILHMCYMR